MDKNLHKRIRIMLLLRVVLSSTLCASSLVLIATETYALKFVYITIISGLDLTVNMVEWICDWGKIFTPPAPPPLTGASLMLSDLRGGGQASSESSESEKSDTSAAEKTWDFGAADVVQRIVEETS